MRKLNVFLLILIVALVFGCDPSGSSGGCDGSSSSSSSTSSSSSSGSIPSNNFAVNGDVESGLTNWSSTAGTVTRTTADKHSGSASVSITGRTANWHGVTFNVGSLTSGNTYDVSVWVKLAPGSANSEMYLTAKRQDDSDTSTYNEYTRVAIATADAYGWTQLQGTYTQSGTPFQYFIIESVDNTVSYYVDDFSIVGGADEPTTPTPTPGYQPCPTNGSPCMILPFGDSITYGTGSSDQGGYRSQLFKRIVQANQKIKFVGSQSNGPNQVAGVSFPKNHEGHSGWTIDPGYVDWGSGISTLIPSPAFNTAPHIVLLMIGTNDVNASKGTDTIANRLNTLLDKIVQAAPKALVVVAEITPIGWNPPAAANYNAKIPGIIQNRINRGQHFALVDMSKMPKSYLGSDNLHPNDAGYAYMADVWYAAIREYLRQ